MRSTGNTLSNQKYNPGNKSPPTTSFSGGDTSEDIELERFIRNKYERKTLLKARKLPPLPSPTTSGDSDKISGQRSPSLGSSSSTNLKIGQRVSGESFERARSPASTNSSLELPPSKPPRSNNSAGNPFVEDPLKWTGLEKNIQSLPNPSSNSAVPASNVLFSQPSLGMQGENLSSTNPFQNSSNFTPQPLPQPPSLQPVPQMISFPSQAQQNPFDEPNEPTVFNPRTTSMPPQQGVQPVWNGGSSYQSTSNGVQMTPSMQSTVFSPPLQKASIVSPSSGASSQTAQNPFFTQQTMSGPLSMSPTNPFFPSQPTNAPFTPMYRPQSQASYQYHQFQPPQPQQLPIQPSQSQQIQFQQQPQYQQAFQPLQTYTSNQTNSNPVYPTPRMDKQSILNLFNTPAPATAPSNPVPQFVQNQNGVPAWSQHGM